MLAFITWSGGCLLLATILLRGLRSEQVRRYPFFYLQIAVSLACSPIGFVTYYLYPMATNTPFYWFFRFLTMFVACGNIWAVLRHVFPKREPGWRFASAMGTALMAAILVFAALYLGRMGRLNFGIQMYGLQRDFRTVQTLILVIVVAAILYFGRRLSRNVKGILFGYSIYIGSSMIVSAVQYYSRGSSGLIGKLVEPCSYELSLVIYLTAMWSYSLPPEPRPILRLAAGEPFA